MNAIKYLAGSKYKTREGASKRAAFETVVQKGEATRGDRAKAYSWFAHWDGTHWRVARHKD